MVLCAQTDFVEFLEQVLEVLKEVEIDKTECYTLLESVQKQQLVIPVVGNFSAGKSTLLNRFLEKSVLPTGITPETSLATELHYSANERIEAFSNNDEKAESFELNEQSFEVIKDNAAEYSYLSDKDNNALLEVADKIDAEKLFSSLYLKRLKFLNARLQNSLKSVIESFDYSKEKALEEIKALDLGVKDIEKTYEKLRANLEEEYSSVAVGSVVKKVLEDVREQKSYLAALINKPNELNSEIESITQQSLIKNTKLEIEKINLSFSKDFHAEFESLNNTQLSSDLSVSLEHNLELGINALSVILSKNPVTRPFALILQGLKPLLKDLLTLLPNIIASFFRNEEKERAKLENLIEVKVIPEVQRKLKEVLPGLFNECLENSLKGLKDRCELEITHKKQEIALAQTEKEKHLNDLEDQKQILENKINALSGLEQQYLKD
ncbi:dynamin family protein [Helicobacter pylori]|uniref:dynamin family protein n=1 Tax=Helicobacter pylori TaxID=210 RepID=UPI0018E21BD5|nr:dynamin family protein [Helicobacter pylori]